MIGIQGLAPSALGSIRSQLFGRSLNSQPSIQGRTADYDAIGPDVWAQPVLGRGVGAYPPTTYRYLDNQYLLSMIETGVVGLAAYFGLLASMLATTRRLLLSHDRDILYLGCAMMSATVAFLVASALFDILSFPHAPYNFFTLAGLAVASTARVCPDE